MTSDNNDRAPKARHSRADREGPPPEVIVRNRQQATFEVIPGAAPDLTSDFNLAVLGYEETEYAVEGRAVSFELQGERGADGRWEVTTGPDATFRTRILVRRPVDAARFSGTAVVEWHNVSGGLDVGPGWGFVHRHIAAQGHAWVGVAVQRAGIDGGAFVNRLHLKRLDPIVTPTSITPATPGPSTSSPRWGGSSASPETRTRSVDWSRRSSWPWASPKGPPTL